MGGLKLFQFTGAIAIGFAAFGTASFFMVQQALEKPPAPPTVIPFAPAAAPNVAPVAPPAVPAAQLVDVPAHPAAPRKPDPVVNERIFPAQTWATKSFWGLPDPRKLTKKEKSALALLGTANDTHTYDFKRMVLSDGSTVPGTPPLTSKEIKDRAIGPVKKKGLADGFEAAIIDLAPHGLNYLTLQVTSTPDWKELEAVLGPPDGKSEGDVWIDPPTGKGNVYFRVAWMRYGWLEFGVGQAKVRVIKADMRHADLVAPESIPGGRSAPDPNRASKSKKMKPHRSPTEPAAEVDALKLLGEADKVKVTTRRSPTKDPKLDETVKKAQNFVGRDIYPNAIESARMMKASLRSEYIIITPSKSPHIDDIIELLGEPSRTSTDASALSGQALTWHHYFWLDFGTVSGRVKLLRVNCLMTPSAGL